MAKIIQSNIIAGNCYSITKLGLWKITERIISERVLHANVRSFMRDCKPSPSRDHTWSGFHV